MKYETSGYDAAFARPQSDLASAQVGMTKREYFAAMAMQALVSSGFEKEYAARLAVQSADALIEELNKETK